MELREKLAAAHERVTVGGTYRHYKNPDSRYRVKELALLEATGEVGVVYESLTDGLVWVRPLEGERGWLILRPPLRLVISL
ncbi:DUF1653 domain-containing protein [Patescibacteria group bacterium]|jgi:hypothetical protein|nr:DUF1653 domain-containing protein [Patescibacteria group bacterium]